MVGGGGAGDSGCCGGARLEQKYSYDGDNKNYNISLIEQRQKQPKQ